MLWVGSGKADITPPVGLPLSGFAMRQNRPSTAIDDPLAVKALALQCGAEQVLLLSYDLLGLDCALDRQVRDRLRDAFGDRFPAGRTIITTTHTHSGPPTMPIAGETRVPEAYIQQLCQATVEATAQAVDRMAEAEMLHAETRVRGLHHNRRIGYAAQPQDFPLDDSLDLFVFRTPAGACLGSLVRFACHAVTMTTQHVSADFPGELTRRLENRLDAPCLFLQGTAGDTNPLVVSQDHPAMLAFVDALMAQIQHLPDRLEPVPIQSLWVEQKSFSLAFAPFPPQEETRAAIERNARILSGDRASPDVQPLLQEYAAWRYPADSDLEGTITHWAEVYSAAAQVTLRASGPGAEQPGAPFHAAALVMGQFTFVFLTGEILTPVGQHIQALAPGRRLRVISYLSPVVGYIADPASYAVGGYETSGAWMWYHMPGPFDANIETTILDQVRSLLAETAENR